MNYLFLPHSFNEKRDLKGNILDMLVLFTASKDIIIEKKL